MPVFHGSRYEGVAFSGIPGVDNTTRAWLHPRRPVRLDDISPDWILYTVVKGDTLDSIVYRYTQFNADKTKLWWLVADVNDLQFPLDIVPGQELIIPVRELANRSI